MKRCIYKLALAAILIQALVAMIFVSPAAKGFRLMELSLAETAVVLLVNSTCNLYERYKMMHAAAPETNEER